MLASAPTADPPLSDKLLRRLLQTAQSQSEIFTRKLTQAAAALDARDGGDGDGASSQPAGLEFVDSLNGIDLYDEVDADGDHEKSTRLCSICHVDVDIKEVVRRLAATAVIIESEELVNLMAASSHTDDARQWVPEHAGINWFSLCRESTRDSGTHSATSSVRSRANSDLWGDSAFEFLVVAYQNVFKHRDRRGWVHWCQSVDLPNFALREGVRRGGLFASGIVAIESATRAGHVTLCYAMGLDLRECTGHERRLLESVVWKRVMKLAAFKKSLIRDSFARTFSALTSELVLDANHEEANAHALDANGLDTNKQDTNAMSLEATTSEHDNQEVHKPEQRATIATQEVERSKTPGSRTRAQTLEPSSLSNQLYRHHGSLYREPTSVLEFRLTYYNEPEDQLDRDSTLNLFGSNDFDALRRSRIDTNNG